MALRKPVSNALKLSHVLNSFAYHKGANLFPSVSSVGSSFIYQNTLVENKTCQRSTPYSTPYSVNIQTNLTNNDSPCITLKPSIWKISEKDSVSQEYKCPSRLTEKFSQLVILDGQTNKPEYQLPLGNPFSSSLIDPLRQTNGTEITDPLPAQQAPVKEAKIIMKIRHQKMKKHKFKKLEQRMRFVWARVRSRQQARRDAVFKKQIEGIKKEGELFDAESYVKEQLQMARKGGYYINVFDSKTHNFEEKKN